jgi:hypothetical protein
VVIVAMTKDPWTDPDPQPGDFDAELEALGPEAFEWHDGDPTATFRVVSESAAEELLRGPRPGRQS